MVSGLIPKSPLLLMIIQQVMLNRMNPLLLLTPTLLNADKIVNNAEQIAYTVIAEKITC